jgi:cytochrome P450
MESGPLVPTRHCFLSFVAFADNDDSELDADMDYYDPCSVTALPARKTTRDVVLNNGTWLPKGSYVTVDILGVQHSSAIWGADAKQFKPERWAQVEITAGEDEDAIPMHPSAHDFKCTNPGPNILLPFILLIHFSFGRCILISIVGLPFGGGQRICLGQQFSIVEQKVVLSMLLLRYKWKVIGNDRALAGNPETAPGILLHSQGIMVEFTRRDLQ